MNCAFSCGNSAPDPTCGGSADVAKGLGVPVLHANADDPEAVVRACRVAARWRARFGRDVIVDVCGYRRCACGRPPHTCRRQKDDLYIHQPTSAAASRGGQDAALIAEAPHQTAKAEPCRDCLYRCGRQGALPLSLLLVSFCFWTPRAMAAGQVWHTEA